MGFSTFATPTSVADVIDKIADDLVTNHNWDSEEDSGSVSAGTTERWISRPSGETVNGRRILAGMRANSGDIELNTIYSGSTYSTTTNFRRKVGQPTVSSATSDGSYMDIEGIRRSRTTINQAILITPEDTSTDSTDHQYFYVLIQCDTHYWYQFGFGELDKTGAITYTGGEFMTATRVYTSSTGYIFNSGRQGQVFGGNGALDTRTPNNQSNFRYGAVYTGGLGSVAVATRGWAHHVTFGSIPNSTYGNTLMSNSVFNMDGLINDGGYSTTGYNFDMPIENYVRVVGSTSQLQFIGTYPRVRAGNTLGRTFGTEFTEGGVDYIAVPFLAADGNTQHSANFGLYFQSS